MASKKHILLLFFLLLFLPLIAVGQTDAPDQLNQWVKPLSETFLQKNKENTIVIPASETIHDNYVRTADSITIEGDVDGDVIVGAFDLTINGDVTGDVIAIAETIELNGDVAGNIRIAAEEVMINGAVGKNATLFVGSATFSNKATIGWSLAFWAGSISVQAPVGGSIYGYGGTIVINNTVGTNVTLILDEQGQATFEKNAEVNGDLNYRSDEAVTITSGAQIHGDTTHKFTPAEILKKRNFLSSAWIFTKIINLFGMLLVGTILVSLFEKTSKKVSAVLIQNNPINLAWGLLVLVGMPTALIIIAITIIGIPLAIIVLGFYLFLLYTAKIYRGLAPNNLVFIAKEKRNKKEIPIIWKMILGVLIIFLVVNIPYIGPFISILLMLWFLGALIKQLFTLYNKNNKTKDETKKDNNKS